MFRLTSKLFFVLAITVCCLVAVLGHTGRNCFWLRRLSSFTYDMTLANCGAKKYNLWLIVEKEIVHVDLVAEPVSENSNNEDCSKALAFSDQLGIKYVADATSYFVEVQEGVPEAEMKFPAGSFTLQDIAAARDSAAVVHGEYDVLTNNCGTFITTTLEYLGVPIDKDMIRFLVNNMAESKKFVQEIRDHPRATELLGQGKSLEKLDDKELLWHFVTTYVNEHSTDKL